MTGKKKKKESRILNRGHRFLFGKQHLLLEVEGRDMEQMQVILEASTLPEHDFAPDLIRYSLEYELEKILEEGEEVPVKTEKTPLSGKDLSGEKPRSVIRVLLPGRILKKQALTDFEKRFRMRLLAGIERGVGTLEHVDFEASSIRAFRLWQAGAHKPQDRAEICFPSCFEENDLLTICSFENMAEKVRVGRPQDKSIKAMDERALSHKEEYAFLTNRLIDIMFGREWITGREEKPGLRGIPFVMYKNEPEVYALGIPKADQIDGVYFSSCLFDAKKEEAKDYDYVVYNRFSDSRLFVDYKKTDYKDYGRVKDLKGNPASKLLIPRYQRKLLGFLDQPLKMIRAEEFARLLTKVSSEEQEVLQDVYEKITGETFYMLREDAPAESLQKAYEILKGLGVYQQAELLKIPKEKKKRRGFFGSIRHGLGKAAFFLLDHAIGKAEYLLKCEWTSETDDRNNVARLSANMMSLLGVSENDKIRIKFGKRVQILRVLANDDLGDYQIGIPATARKKLGMNSVNDIVVVDRDMVHAFLRHSEEQTIAMLGTVLAVFQVVSSIWLGILLCLIFIPVIMYFVLNEERIKVK